MRMQAVAYTGCILHTTRALIPNQPPLAYPMYTLPLVYPMYTLPLAYPMYTLPLAYTGYSQSDMQLPLQGLAPLLTPLNITPTLQSGALVVEGALDQPGAPWRGSTMVSLTLPNGGVALGGRSGQYMDVDVQRVGGVFGCVCLWGCIVFWECACAWGLALENHNVLTHPLFFPHLLPSPPPPTQVNITVPIAIALLTTECAIIDSIGGGPGALSQASKNPTRQDVAQRLPLLLLLQRNGFCGQVDAYITPTTDAAGGGVDQSAYVARVVVRGSVTLHNMPVAVVGVQPASNGGGAPGGSSVWGDSSAGAPLFGYAYATQGLLGSTAGVCAVTVDVWQQCAGACEEARGCVGWTHYAKVCVFLCTCVFGVVCCM